MEYEREARHASARIADLYDYILALWEARAVVREYRAERRTELEIDPDGVFRFVDLGEAGA